MAAHEFRGVAGVAFDRVPDIAIEDVLVDEVRLAEVHLLDLIRVMARLGGEHGGAAGGQIYVVRQGGIGGEVGCIGEAIEHERAHGVLLVHRGEAHDLLHRMQEAGLIVESADHLVAFGVRADDEAERAVAIDMIVAALGVVLDDEDDGIAGKDARGDRLHNGAEGQIVVGDLGLGWRDAAGVVVGEIEEMKGGPVATGLGGV